MNGSNMNSNANLFVNANVAIERNCKINFAKASVEMCQKSFRILQEGTFKLVAFNFWLTCIFAFWVKRVIKCVYQSPKYVQHYYMLYRLRKRGGICQWIRVETFIRILRIMSKKKHGGIRSFLTIKQIVPLCVGMTFWICLFSGNLVAYERPWFDNFDDAIQTAKNSGRNLLIYFSANDNNLSSAENSGSNSGSNSESNSGSNSELNSGSNSGSSSRSTSVSKQLRNRVQGGSLSYMCVEFERNVFESAELYDVLDKYVILKIRFDEKVFNDEGNEVPILELPMFKEMVGVPGLAIIDFENTEASYYGEVVGVLPFINFTYPNQFQTRTFLTIPSGKLTQRTLTYAVKIHPDRPLSADGEVEPTLLTEATGHAEYQAKNRVLGHQNFSARSSRVRAVLGESISEVCAQSGMYGGHFEAALACVRGWRGSPAHWRCVRAKQKYYAYDMVQSSNGLWYATGLFVSP